MRADVADDWCSCAAKRTHSTTGPQYGTVCRLVVTEQVRAAAEGFIISNSENWTSSGARCFISDVWRRLEMSRITYLLNWEEYNELVGGSAAGDMANGACPSVQTRLAVIISTDGCSSKQAGRCHIWSSLCHPNTHAVPAGRLNGHLISETVTVASPFRSAIDMSSHPSSSATLMNDWLVITWHRRDE